MFPQTSVSVLDSTLKRMYTLEGAVEHLFSGSQQSDRCSFAFIFMVTLSTNRDNIVNVQIFIIDE